MPIVLIEPKKLAEDFAVGDFDLFLDDDDEEDREDGCATFKDAPERGAPAGGSTGASLGRPLRCWPVVAIELTGKRGNLTLTELILKQISLLLRLSLFCCTVDSLALQCFWYYILAHVYGCW